MDFEVDRESLTVSDVRIIEPCRVILDLLLSDQETACHWTGYISPYFVTDSQRLVAELKKCFGSKMWQGWHGQGWQEDNWAVFKTLVGWWSMDCHGLLQFPTNGGLSQSKMVFSIYQTEFHRMMEVVKASLSSQTKSSCYEQELCFWAQIPGILSKMMPNVGYRQ